MIIDFTEYLGLIKNDNNVIGKAFIFNVITENEYTFEVVLFVHETAKVFISVAEEDKNQNQDKETILGLIFEKYTLKQLLEVA